MYLLTGECVDAPFQERQLVKVTDLPEDTHVSIGVFPSRYRESFEFAGRSWTRAKDSDGGFEHMERCRSTPDPNRVRVPPRIGPPKHESSGLLLGAKAKSSASPGAGSKTTSSASLGAGIVLQAEGCVIGKLQINADLSLIHISEPTRPY